MLGFFCHELERSLCLLQGVGTNGKHRDILYQQHPGLDSRHAFATATFL